VSILIAIPARGSSQRLPRKNILPLNKTPLIIYTIEAAQKADITSDIWVCTDNDEIADISKDSGAKIYGIPDNMARDDVSSTEPCLALLSHLKQQGKIFDYIFNLQPTSPLRNSEDIILSLETIKNNKADFLVSVTEIDPHYFHWAMIERENKWQMYFGNKYMKERIYLESTYRPNGAIKLARTKQLIKKGNFFGNNLTVYNMPEERSIHVGNAFDFSCAEGLLKIN
jgi:CMP-N,N'-diacetyllegionaminic acid synthase